MMAEAKQIIIIAQVLYLAVKEVQPGQGCSKGGPLCPLDKPYVVLWITHHVVATYLCLESSPELYQPIQSADRS